MTKHDDDLNIPNFLDRKNETPAQAAARVKKTAADAKKFAEKTKAAKLDAAKKAIAKVAAAAVPVVREIDKAKQKLDEAKAMTPHAQTAMARINEARKADGLREYTQGKREAATKVPKKAGKLVEKAIAQRDALKKTAKEAAAKSASKPKTAEKAKSKSAGRKSPERKQKVELLLKTLARKDGVTNADMIKALGKRVSAHSMKLICQNHDKRLKIVKKEGEPTRYMI